MEQESPVHRQEKGPESLSIRSRLLRNAYSDTGAQEPSE